MTINAQMQVMAIENGQLVRQSFDTPTPKPDEVLIQTAYSGVNRADLFQVEGSYPPPEGLPNIPGLEISGIIVAVGGDVTQWSVGDEVCALLGGCGYSDYVCVDASLCLPIPKTLSLKDAAALPECAATIWLALFDEANIQKVENVLVHGGSSGVGITAIQMLRAFGCEVWVTAGTDEKCATCEKLGAKAINYKAQDFVSIIKENGGVDVVLDMVGGDYINRNLKCLKKHGRMVSIAMLNGAKADINAGGLLLKNLHWSGVTLRSQSLERKTEIIQQLQKTVWPWVENGQFTPVIDCTFPLTDASLAHDHMQKSLHIGKILLEVNVDKL